VIIPGLNCTQVCIIIVNYSSRRQHELLNIIKNGTTKLKPFDKRRFASGLKQKMTT